MRWGLQHALSFTRYLANSRVYTGGGWCTLNTLLQGRGEEEEGTLSALAVPPVHGALAGSSLPEPVTGGCGHVSEAGLEVATGSRGPGFFEPGTSFISSDRVEAWPASPWDGCRPTRSARCHHATRGVLNEEFFFLAKDTQQKSPAGQTAK